MSDSIFKYNSKYCILGMMSKGSILFDNLKGFKKNKTTSVSFDSNFDPGSNKVSYSYIYDKPLPPIKSYKSTQLVSELNEDFFALSGQKYREIRETRNHFNKIVSIKEYNKQDVLDLIQLWSQTDGKKYGFQLHSGYDRNFFNNWYDLEKDNLFSRFYYIGDKLVGYSVLHKGENCWEYLLRKADNSTRNTCLFIDYKTFEQIWDLENKPFCVCWGASKGNLLKYKRKFGSFDERDVYFYKIVK